MPERHLVLPHPHIDELPQTARQIIDFAGDEKIWLFEGPMGAGKTTLIKAICHTFGVQDIVNSPTFALVNEYRNATGRIFYHFDFYRINSVEEALDIGTEDYFYSGNHCLIEWPSQVESLIPERNLRIQLQLQEDSSEVLPERVRDKLTRSIYLQRS